MRQKKSISFSRSHALRSVYIPQPDGAYYRPQCSVLASPAHGSVNAETLGTWIQFPFRRLG